MLKSNNKVSIIISVLNGGSTLERCVQSIIDQSYINCELIIIDGGSTDNTIDIIKSFASKISFWVSERDTGIYNAWNKAVRKATGEWFCFIGSDDILLPDSISKLVGLADYPNVNFICSRVMMVDNNGKDVGSIGKNWNFKNLAHGLCVVHCGALHHNSLFENDQLFDETYKIAADFEFLVRVGRNIMSAFLNDVTVKMCNRGVSRSNVNQVIFETSRALYYSNDFKKIDGIKHFISAHIRSVVRKIIFHFPFGNKLFALRNKPKS